MLLSEYIHSARLDSGCSSTVELVTVFEFGGGEKIKSEKITLSCWLAGVKFLTQTDVVNSKIPLLLSKMAMKKAKIKLDLVHDKAEIFEF